MHKPLSLLEQWAVSLTSLWLMAGLFIDTWAHNHIGNTIESFFTPWHAVFYSGYAALTVVLLAITWRRKEAGKSFLNAIPDGYGWALFGSLLFLFGGVGDMLWHQIFGIEVDIEALLSPTHLVLATAGFLIQTGPVLAWWRLPAEERAKPAIQVPVMINYALLLMVPSFLTQFSHFIDIRMTGAVPDLHEIALSRQAVSITGYVWHTVVLTAGILFASRHTRLIPGAATLILGLPAVAFGYARFSTTPVILSVIVAGLLIDILLTQVDVSQSRRGVRLIAFLIPSIILLCYFATILFSYSIWWSVHLWTGCIVIVGLAGVLVSFLLWPPPTRA